MLESYENKLKEGYETIINYTELIYLSINNT